MMIKKIHFVGTGLALSSVCKKNVNVWEIDLTEKDTASSAPTQPQSFIPLLKNSTVQEKNIDYNHLSPSQEPNVALTVGTMACLVLTAKPLKVGKNGKFNKGWEPLKGHKNEEVEKIVKIFYLDTTNSKIIFFSVSIKQPGL